MPSTVATRHRRANRSADFAAFDAWLSPWAGDSGVLRKPEISHFRNQGKTPERRAAARLLCCPSGLTFFIRKLRLCNGKRQRTERKTSCGQKDLRGAKRRCASGIVSPEFPDSCRQYAVARHTTVIVDQCKQPIQNMSPRKTPSSHDLRLHWPRCAPRSLRRTLSRKFGWALPAVCSLLCVSSITIRLRTRSA